MKSKTDVDKLLGETLRRRKKFSLKSEGLSMGPILQPNDIVFYQREPFRSLKINDIILVRKNKLLFTHRIIYRLPTYLITKGDNNLKSDGKIYEEQVMGKAYQVKRHGKILDLDHIYLFQSSLYFQEITTILGQLGERGIQYVILKGLPLHLYYEKTHPRRIYLDCDILIEKEHIQKAKNILKKSGYSKVDNWLSNIQKNLRDKESENAFIKRINGFPVVFDIHTEAVFMMTQLGRLDAIYPQSLIDRLTKEFLSCKRQIKINNRQLSVLSPCHLVLYLVLHFFHHNFQGAFRLELLDKIIRKEKFSTNDWKSIRISVDKYHVKNFVYPAFVLLEKLYRTPIPRTFLVSLRPSHSCLQYLSSSLNHPYSIFDDEPRIKSGINRFKNLFFLSPLPLPMKFLVFLNPQVLYAMFWLLKGRLFSFFAFPKASRQHPPPPVSS